jgi:phosphorylcholine metabolism protein LicD
VTEKHNMQIFLLYGSLLGKIRENKIIEHDYDLDFGINNYDYEKMKNALKKQFKNNDDFTVEIIEFLWYKHIAIIHKKTKLNADIIVFKSDKKHMDTLSNYLYAFLTAKQCSMIHPIDWFYPLKKTYFLGRQVYIPNKSHKLLKCYYGKNYMIPKKY